METHPVQKNILNLALFFQLLYLFAIGLVNLLCATSLMPERIIRLYILNGKYVPVTDYVRMFSTCIITIIFLLVYVSFSKKMKQKVRLTRAHTIKMGLCVYVLYYAIPLLTTICILKIRYYSIPATMEEVISASVVNGVQVWVRIFQFVAVVLLLCSYAMYWYESNVVTSAKE